MVSTKIKNPALTKSYIPTYTHYEIVGKCMILSLDDWLASREESDVAGCLPGMIREMMLHKTFDSMLICTNGVIGGFKLRTSILVYSYADQRGTSYI